MGGDMKIDRMRVIALEDLPKEPRSLRARHVHRRVRFVDGAPARPWWKYTAERKRTIRKRTSIRQTH
jgi:hypothetical protein